MTRWLLLFGLILTACASATVEPPPTASLLSFSTPTLDVVLPEAVAECGPEAAIALAQTQSDLALAAAAQVDMIQQATQDPALIAQAGKNAFTAARDLMKAYAVPDCLLQGKEFAVLFFDERLEAYAALASGDQGGYEANLNEGETARQNMIAVVNGILGQ
jgi:hypothetical protein